MAEAERISQPRKKQRDSATNENEGKDTFRICPVAYSATYQMTRKVLRIREDVGWVAASTAVKAKRRSDTEILRSLRWSLMQIITVRHIIQKPHVEATTAGPIETNARMKIEAATRADLSPRRTPRNRTYEQIAYRIGATVVCIRSIASRTDVPFTIATSARSTKEIGYSRYQEVCVSDLDHDDPVTMGSAKDPPSQESALYGNPDSIEGVPQINKENQQRDTAKIQLLEDLMESTTLVAPKARDVRKESGSVCIRPKTSAWFT